MRVPAEGIARLSAAPMMAPLWVALRFYLGITWLRFGISKIDAGWLTTNPLRPILEAVSGGGIPVPLESYRPVAGIILGTGADRLLCLLIPLTEVAFGVLFLAGTLLFPTAAAATLLNLNLLLSGIAVWRFDGVIIGLQLFLMAGAAGAGRFGLGTVLHVLREGDARRRGHPDARALTVKALLGRAEAARSRLQHPGRRG